MKTIVLLNNKGGVAKTTTVTTVGHILATEYGKKVLVVDLDPQGNTSNLFGTTDFVTLIRARLSKTATEDSGLYHVGDLLIDDELDPHTVIKKTAYENLDLLPSYPTLAAIEEKLKADIKRPQQYRLKAHLDRIKNEYDFCLIDCAPSLSILNVNALVAANEVYIPTLADDGSLFGIELTISELIAEVQRYSMNLKIGGIFFTKYKENYKVSKFAKELLENVYSEWLLPFRIHENVVVSECPYHHMPLLAYDRGMKARATQDYIALAGYMAAKNKKTYLKNYNEKAG